MPLIIIRFSNFFTLGLYSTFATNSCLNIPPHPKRVATLPCEIFVLKNRHSLGVSEANYYARLSHSNTVLK